MTALKLLCHSAGFNSSVLSKEEMRVLEADLFSRICNELTESYKAQYEDYFRIIRFNHEMENIMDKNLVSLIVRDILSTEEYSLLGVAYYTGTSEDVIFEIASGNNSDPSASLLRKIIELHRAVRPDLYREIMKKVICENTRLE